MGQDSVSHSLLAFNLMREAAREYNNAEYKFYSNGFVKYVKEGAHTVLIDDIYIRPEYRGTPVASMMLESFEDFLRKERVLSYYGRVFHGSPKFEKRIETFKKWGMEAIKFNDLYTIVKGEVSYE